MTSNGYFQILLYLVVLMALVVPIGSYMANVYEGRKHWLSRVLGPLERGLYRMANASADAEMTWTSYACAMLAFSAVGMVVVYVLQRVQQWLPLNPAALGAVTPHLAFNTAASFVSNTNWQSYGGETTLSYLTQMTGLTVQNFVSAATGMAVMVALARGLARREQKTIGSFWVDITRSTLYILLPLSIVWTLAQTSQGVVQTLGPYVTAHVMAPAAGTENASDALQTLARGPVSSQIAIKQLGTNGGGFFNANSAHPFENPTPFSNFIEMLGILLIPAACCYTFGRLVKDRRQGWALLAAMSLILVVALAASVASETRGTPNLARAGTDLHASAMQAGGNMEGKETRFGVVNSAMWATVTTAASNGSVNAMHDSFTPLGGLVQLVLMNLGEVVFGGVGSGLYGMLMYVLVAVFVAGLMVGRTPEYLGKKIEPFEMKMASIAVLIPPALVLLGTAVTVVTKTGVASMGNHGAHGFSEILYAFSSMGNNNGSAFAGYSANIPLVNTLGGIAMLISRFWLAIPVLAVAGSMAAKKSVPVGAGTLATHTPLFVFLLVGTVLLVGALTFIPALALGPVVEQLTMIH